MGKIIIYPSLMEILFKFNLVKQQSGAAGLLIFINRF